MSTPARRAISAALAAIASIGIAVTIATPASAEPASHGSFSGPGEICGIAVNVNDTFNGTTLTRKDGSIVFQGVDRTTFTNPLTGKSVTLSAAGPVRVTDTFNADGTVTETATFIGVPERISGANGTLLRDAGQVTQTTIFNADTGEEITSTVTVIAGPHPEADSGFTALCDVVVPALT